MFKSSMFGIKLLCIYVPLRITDFNHNEIFNRTTNRKFIRSGVLFKPLNHYQFSLIVKLYDIVD